MGAGAELLLAYYKRSWNGVIPEELCHANVWRDYRTMREAAEKLLTTMQAGILDRRVLYFRKHIAPVRRYALIEKFLENTWRRRVVIDIGAGGAGLGRMMSSQMEGSGCFYSIEPRGPEIVEQHHVRATSILPDERVRYDIALFCFSLHHMREVDIRRYVKMLSEMNCSEIIIIEDTMSAPTEIELIDDLTAIFYESPEQDRRELLELNEIVSNVWMYEGDVAQGWAEHRTTEQWQAIFSDYGYVSEIEFLVGFDYHRLHGAPAVVMRFRYSPRTIRHA